jgi:hypothetical protein
LGPLAHQHHSEMQYLVTSCSIVYTEVGKWCTLHHLRFNVNLSYPKDMIQDCPKWLPM